MIFAVGVVSIILIGIMFVCANVCAAAAVDSGSKGYDLWIKICMFIQALSIIGLLIYFAINVI